MTKKTEKKSQNILEAELIAKYYGFAKENPEEVTKEDEKIAASVCRQKGYLDEMLAPIEEVYALLRRYRDDKSKDMVEPSMSYHEGVAAGKHTKHRNKAGEEIINLHMINVGGSIAEATLIQTAKTILAENGVKNILVKLNDIGDKDAQTAFYREVTNYYRKNINELNNNCRQLFKESVHALITKGKNQCVSIHEQAPKPMEFLGEEARKRFGEVLEFLETLEIPYEIDQSILGEQNYSSHTVFEIIDKDSEKVVAAGTRYDTLARKCGLRKDIPSATVVINLKDPKTTSEKSIKKFDKTKFYFLQIGYAAKLKALGIIDELRRENIPVLHKTYRDRLSTQISSAKKADSDYLIIMGQKEALSDELIIRDKDSKSQVIVKRPDLIAYLKKMK